MLIKKADDPSPALAQLEALADSASAEQKSAAEDELRKLRAGIKGEREAAYLIDFDHAGSPDMAVIHELRLESNGQVAQIDHLLIHRSLHCFVLETKQVHAGIKITDSGEFVRWNEWRSTYEGMASPLAQNERHIRVLQDVFAGLLLPQRSGVSLTPVFHAFVLVPPSARIIRPEEFDTRRVIQMDLLRSQVESELAQASVPVASGEGALISPGALENLARQLAARHQPRVFDYARKLGLTESSEHGSESAGRTDALPLEFSARRNERSRGNRQSGRRAFAWFVRLIYAGVLILIGSTLLNNAKQLVPVIAIPSAERNVEPQQTPTPPPNAITPESLKLNFQSLLPAPIPQAVPSASVAPAEPEPPPTVEMDDQSITATGKFGARLGEIRGNLPKIREEMRRSRLAAKPVHPRREADGEADARCEPKPVMTDADIAACREIADRR